MGASEIIGLLGGIALFLFGMAIMGDGLKKVAGSKLELVLYKLTSTPLKGVLLGTGVTAVIQSSSATSVMVVGFVNSGMMKVNQAIGIVMGDSFIANLLAPAGLKDFVENDDRLKNGKEVLYNNPLLAARDVTLSFVIMGSTPEDHLANLRSFYTLLQAGKVTINVPAIGNDVNYHLTYMGSSNSYSLSADRCTSKLSVKFNEPNPANRT